MLHESLLESIHALKKQSHRENIHLIGDKTEDGTISICYIPIDKVAVDIFTKKSVLYQKCKDSVLMREDTTQSAKV